MIQFTPAPTLPTGSKDYYAAPAMRQTIGQDRITQAGVAISTTGIMNSYAVAAYAGDVITNLTFAFGTTLTVSPTHWWFALYDTTRTLIDQTADQLTVVPAVSSTPTLALGLGPTRLSVSGNYYISLMMAAGTQPTLRGAAANVGSSVLGPYLTGELGIAISSGSGLTTTAPGTIVGTSVGSLAAIPYGVLS